MPIVVKQSPVGIIGQLSVMAGQARGQQLRADRDLQFTSMALAAEDRAAQIGMAAHDRLFAIQQAGAAQIARQRPATPDTRAKQGDLQQFVSEARSSGIYSPAQIKQAGIFAKLGDAGSVRSILSKLPTPAQAPAVPAAEQERQRQLRAVTNLRDQNIKALTAQFDKLGEKYEGRFDKAAQRFYVTRPEMDRFLSAEDQKTMAAQRELQEKINDVAEQTGKAQQLLKLGLSIPAQMKFESDQETALVRQDLAEQRIAIQRARGTGGLTEEDNARIDLMRDREREQRTVLDREVARLTKDLAQFDKESDKDYAERVKPVQARIQQLSLERVASHAREKKQFEGFIRRDKSGVTPMVTDKAGQRWRFTGRYQNGKPLYEAVE